MNINLCFVTDDNYAMPTCVTISSVLENKSEANKYSIFILSKNVSVEKKNKFMEMDRSDFKINIIEIDDNKDLSKYYIPGIPATPTSIYKFFIPEILANIDKVIYLDGDIIVQKDLEELYNIDLNGNMIGAVKDTNGLDYKKYCCKEYSYINSGVLLMDLSQMREKNISNKMMDYRRTGFNKLMDQDTINYVLKDSILILPFKYNTQTNTLSGNLIDKKKYNLDKIKLYWNIQNQNQTLKDIFENAVVLHYATAKPWKFYDGYGNDLWLEHYLKSPYGKDKLFRESKYISKIVDSNTYKLIQIILIPIKFVKSFFKNKKCREYKKFLKKFLYK